MDNDNVNVVDDETSEKKLKTHVWQPEIFMVFLDECMTEFRNGNKTGSTFNKTGKENIIKRVHERTGKLFTHKQLKNKWDSMKKDFKIYDKLMRLETGVGFDPLHKKIIASEKWWNEKIKANEEYSKFKDKNLEIYEIYYEPLFRDSVAVGDKAMAPSEFVDNSTPDDVEIADITEENEDGDENYLFGSVDPLLAQGNKKRKCKKLTPIRATKAKTEGNPEGKAEGKTEGKPERKKSMEEKLDTVIEAIATRSAQISARINHSRTTEECMEIVATFPGFEEGSFGYLQALRVFLKPANRVNFMVPKSNETKMEFLKMLIGENN